MEQALRGAGKAGGGGSGRFAREVTGGYQRTRLRGRGGVGVGGIVKLEGQGRGIQLELHTGLEYHLTNTIWRGPSYPLASALGMEHNHPIFGMLGRHGGQVEIYRHIYHFKLKMLCFQLHLILLQ